MSESGSRPAAPVYLDYAATTPVDPRVARRMSECLLTDGNFGNPASRSHRFGWEAEEAVERARRQVADLLHCDPREVVWTSGATESDNLAVKGVVNGVVEEGRAAHVVTSMIEHKAVIDTCRFLERQGCEVSWLEPAADGRVSPQQVAAALREDTALVSLMYVNNEIGAINDIAAIGALCRQRGVPLHVDAAQAASRLALDLAELPVDLLSLSAHKMYGPKGVGALYVRRSAGLSLVPLMHGGGHERGYRSGTLPTHQIVGMGEAARLCGAELAEETRRVRALRERLWTGLQDVAGLSVNGDPARTVAGILNIGVSGVDGEQLLMAASDIAVSTGSACTSTSVEPSYVLRAIGVPDALAGSSLRISFGRFTTGPEIDRAVDCLRRTVRQLRQASPARQAARHMS